MPIEVPENTVVVYADLVCPFAALTMYRLHQQRGELDLVDRVQFDVRAYPLELFNNKPTPRDEHDPEITALALVSPETGWHRWTGPDWGYPVSSLLALEAVQAVKAQSARLAEMFDLALRHAFFRDSRCIALRHEILAVAAGVGGLDVAALTVALDTGVARPVVIGHWREAVAERIAGSPTVITPDGIPVTNPGVVFHWEGTRVVVDSANPRAFTDLLRAAIA